MISFSGATPIKGTCFLAQNFSIPEPRPESIITASVLIAALAAPAKVLAALYVIAPISKITGVGYENFKRSQTSEIRKSGSSGLFTLINFATFPPGIIMSCKVQASEISAP